MLHSRSVASIPVADALSCITTKAITTSLHRLDRFYLAELQKSTNIFITQNISIPTTDIIAMEYLTLVCLSSLDTYNF